MKVVRVFPKNCFGLMRCTAAEIYDLRIRLLKIKR